MSEEESKTQVVKSRHLQAGWFCFIAGLILVFVNPLGLFFIFAPLFLASFILSVIGIAKGRIAAGIALLLVTIIIPLASFLSASAYQFAKISRQLDVEKRDKLSSLTIEDLRGYPDGEYMYVEGKVRNNGSSPISYVKVRVEWFDDSGIVVDTDWTYAIGGENLSPGSAKSFSIMTKKDKKMKKFQCQIVEP